MARDWLVFRFASLKGLRGHLAALLAPLTEEGRLFLVY
jgi:hypothetical protein